MKAGKRQLAMSPRTLLTLQSPSCSQASPAPMKAGKRQLAMSPHHWERPASQAAASAAWGQTWEIRIPVCSAIESADVNLARRPAAAALHSSQEGAKPAEARARVAERSRTFILTGVTFCRTRSIENL